MRNDHLVVFANDVSSEFLAFSMQVSVAGMRSDRAGHIPQCLPTCAPLARSLAIDEGTIRALDILGVGYERRMPVGRQCVSGIRESEGTVVAYISAHLRSSPGLKVDFEVIAAYAWKQKD